MRGTLFPLGLCVVLAVLLAVFPWLRWHRLNEAHASARATVVSECTGGKAPSQDARFAANGQSIDAHVSCGHHVGDQLEIVYWPNDPSVNALSVSAAKRWFLFNAVIAGLIPSILLLLILQNRYVLWKLSRAPRERWPARPGGPWRGPSNITRRRR